MRNFTLNVMSSLALGLLAQAALLPAAARGQIFVTNANTGVVGEYNSDTGHQMNSALIVAPTNPLNNPTGIVMVGSDLFVVDNAGDVPNDGYVGEYTSAGSGIKSHLITGLNNPVGIVSSGSDLYISNYLNGTIGEYTTSGHTISAALISKLNDPGSLYISGSDLFVTNYADGTAGAGTVGEYSLTGTAVHTSLITGLSGPTGIAVLGSHIYVTDNVGGDDLREFNMSGVQVGGPLETGLGNPMGIGVFGSDLYIAMNSTGTIGQYNTSNGAWNPTFISGLSTGPYGITVCGIPEPSTDALLALAAVTLLAIRPRRRTAIA